MYISHMYWIKMLNQNEELKFSYNLGFGQGFLNNYVTFDRIYWSLSQKQLGLVDGEIVWDSNEAWIQRVKLFKLWGNTFKTSEPHGYKKKFIWCKSETFKTPNFFEWMISYGLWMKFSAELNVMNLFYYPR